MDQAAVIVSAIALGAMAGLKETTALAVKDAYLALKKLIGSRYPDVDLAPLEQKPNSESKRDSLGEDLIAAGASQDAEILEAAQNVITNVKAHDAAIGPALGIDLDRVEAVGLRIRQVRSQGGGVRVRDGKFTGDIEIGEVHTGDVESNRP